MEFKSTVIYFVALFLVGCASGSAIVTGIKRPAISHVQVKLYLQPPSNYEVIGLVSASSDAGWTEQGSQDYAVEEIKKQAAKLGANGVLLTSNGERTSTAIGGYGNGMLYAAPIMTKTVSGQAIYISEK